MPDILRKFLTYFGSLGSLGDWKTSMKEHADRKLLLDSVLFDRAFYVDHYGMEIAASKIDPVEHYLRIGGLRGYNPSREFDASLYYTEYPDVREAKLNPLIHYLRHGFQEGRAIHRLVKGAPKPKAPSKAQWQELASQDANAKTPVIDVVVPVYRGFDETANCLYTLLRSKPQCAVPCEIVVIDDQSPESELSALLDDIAARGMITLLRNKKNEGFVSSVNRGMKLHNDRDVILLNSDTEVFGNWIDRLQRAAYSEANIGSVTPFSNNATICSYPDFPGQFKGSFEVSFEEMDRLASQANPGMTVDIPTAVGFCMYIRRECLQECGFFDVAAFGLGYGEENDFSLRIAQHGWRNVLAGDVFVRHLGNVSFLDSTEERVKAGLQTIKTRYPHFMPSVAAHTKQDPSKPLRRNLDIARLRLLTGDRSVLFLLHNLGGGTLKHVREISELLGAEGMGALWLQPSAKDTNIAVVSHAKAQNLSNNVQIDLKHGLSQAAELVRDLGVVHIHVHHILGFGSETAEWVQQLAQQCNLSYDVTIHDYFLACPRVTMIDESGRYCGNSRVERCETCIKTNDSPAGNVSAWYWRARNGKLMANARKIFVPNKSVQRHMNDFFPSLNFELRAHPESPIEQMPAPILREPGEALRVAVIGAIGAHKGSLLLKQCAEDAVKRDLPIEFHVIGFSDRSDMAKFKNVTLTGRYSEKRLPELLARKRCHLAFFPAMWPETYSYTLSQAWHSALYPVAFDLGAIADRIRENNWGHILPNEMMGLPSKVNDALLSIIPPSPPVEFKPVAGSNLYRDIWHDYYGFN